MAIYRYTLHVHLITFIMLINYAHLQKLLTKKKRNLAAYFGQLFMNLLVQ